MPTLKSALSATCTEQEKINSFANKKSNDDSIADARKISDCMLRDIRILIFAAAVFAGAVVMTSNYFMTMQQTVAQGCIAKE